AAAETAEAEEPVAEPAVVAAPAPAPEAVVVPEAVAVPEVAAPEVTPDSVAVPAPPPVDEPMAGRLVGQASRPVHSTPEPVADEPMAGRLEEESNPVQAVAAGTGFAGREADSPQEGESEAADAAQAAAEAAADGEGFANQAAEGEDEAEADAEAAAPAPESESTEEETAVAVMEDEGPEPARIPTSLTAALREQGGRYPHRVSRRTRRKGRGDRGPAPEGQRGPQGEPRPLEQGSSERTIQRPESRPDGPPDSRPESRPEARPDTRGDKIPLPSISDLLKEGQEIIVQIAKEPLGQKGARITSHIALPGRFLVYMPTVDHIGVSRKI